MTPDSPAEYGACPRCGALTLPVLAMSPCGHADAPLVRQLAAPGVVYSWTRVAAPTATVLAMVDFFDGALRVAGPVAASDVAIGDHVLAVVGADTPIVFRPSKGADQ